MTQLSGANTPDYQRFINNRLRHNRLRHNNRGATTADYQLLKQNRLRQNTQPIFVNHLTIRYRSATLDVLSIPSVRRVPAAFIVDRDVPPDRASR